MRKIYQFNVNEDRRVPEEILFDFFRRSGHSHYGGRRLITRCVVVVQ